MQADAPTPPRRRRWPLVLLAAAAVLVALGSAAVLALDGYLLGRARERAAALSRDLGRPVELGGLSVRLLPPGLRATGIRVGPAKGEEEPLLEIGRAEVRVGLLRAVATGLRRVEVGSAEVEGLRLTVVRHRDGSTNLGRLLRALEERAARQAPPAPRGARDLSFLQIERAALVDGRIAFVDRSGKEARRLAVDDIDAEVVDLAAGRPLDVSLRAAVLSDRQNLEVRLHAAPLPPTLEPVPERLTLRSEPIDLGSLAPFLPAGAGLRAGRFQADLEAALGAAVPGGSGPTRVKGGLQADDLLFAGQRARGPLRVVLRADVEADVETGDARIGELRIEAGPASIAGKGTVVSLRGERPRVEGLEVVSKDLDLARLGEHVPALARALGGRVSGPIGLSLRGAGTAEEPSVELAVDLTPARLSLPGTLSKAAGGRMRATARVRGGPGALRFALSADLAGADLRPGRSLDKAPGDRLDAEVEGTTEVRGSQRVVTLSGVGLRILSDSVAGTGTVVLGGTADRPATRFGADLKSARLDLDRLLLEEKGKKSGERRPPLDRAVFAGLSGEAKVRVGAVRLRRQELRDVVLVARMQGDEVTLEQADLRAFGGEVSAAGTRVRLAAAKEPFQAKLRARGVELGDALQLFTARKVVAGRFDGDVDLQGGGAEGAAVAATLAGVVGGRVLDGAFLGKDLVAGVAAPLARALPFGVPGAAPKGGSTPLGKELPFRLRFEKGAARLEKPLAVRRPEADIALEGGFRLDGTLDMPATVALSPDTVARITGGRARPKEAVPVRFRLTGPAWRPTLSDLALKPAAAAIAKEAGSAALGKVLGEKAEGEKAPPAQKAEEALKRGLEGIFRRRK